MTQDGGREAKVSSGERHRWGRSPGARSTGPLLPCYSTPVSLVMTCAQCREQVLEAEQIEDEEECLLRDQHLAVHPTTIQPETRRVLLQHFVITEPSPPLSAARSQEPRLGARVQGDELGVLARKPLQIECEEGDLNPHGFYPTSPSIGTLVHRCCGTFDK